MENIKLVELKNELEEMRKDLKYFERNETKKEIDKFTNKLLKVNNKIINELLKKVVKVGSDINKEDELIYLYQEITTYTKLGENIVFNRLEYTE